jgi:phospholipid transport system substrate-binding protein
MQTIRFLLAAAVLAGLTSLRLAAASIDDPQAVLRTAVDEVMAIAYAPATSAEPLSTRVRPVLENYFTFEGITRRAVGPGWRQFTPDQRARITALFTQLVIRTYADKFTPGEKPVIAFGAATELAANRREVPSSITYQGAKYSVGYRLERETAGWRIYDVNIEGVSMVANYRGQFEALNQKGGAEAILRSLQTKITELDAPKAP